MIRVQKVIVKGEFETDFTVSDIKELEQCRKQLSDAYGDKPFEVTFILQTENFENVKYPDQKKRK